MVDNGNDLVDHEMHRRMSLVAPHARRAVLIGRTIDQKANEVATLADALDSLSAGVFLIEANGRIVHANAAGRGILGVDDFLRSIGGRLVARDTKINRTLQDSFAGRGDLEIGSRGIALPLTARKGDATLPTCCPWPRQHAAAPAYSGRSPPCSFAERRWKPHRLLTSSDGPIN